MNEDDLRKYLDTVILYWRKKLNNCDQKTDDYLIARCYIDAYQSVRVSLLGELLE